MNDRKYILKLILIGVYILGVVTLSCNKELQTINYSVGFINVMFYSLVIRREDNLSEKVRYTSNIIFGVGVIIGFIILFVSKI